MSGGWREELAAKNITFAKVSASSLDPAAGDETVYAIRENGLWRRATEAEYHARGEAFCESSTG